MITLGLCILIIAFALYIWGSISLKGGAEAVLYGLSSVKINSSMLATVTIIVALVGAAVLAVGVFFELRRMKRNKGIRERNEQRRINMKIKEELEKRNGEAPAPTDK